MINVAVLGYGTVGGGVVEVLDKNKDVVAKKVGEEVSLKYILDLRDFPGDKFEDKIVHDFEEIINDPEIDIIAEAMGGVEPAFTFAKRALSNAKSFCTSNKELVAKHGPELIKLAKDNNVNFLFEASVGGGIPIIRPLLDAVTADEIISIEGILNGTTNYILTKMDRDGVDYDTVLKEAQDKGYAERNPEADVEGYDAVRKISILGSLAYGKHIDFEEVYTEGITKISAEDFKYARAISRAIKLIGSVKHVEGKYYAMVSPLMLSEENPLYAVNGVFNGILVNGNMVDKVMFYGRGAGKLPTASAVVSDIVEEAKLKKTNKHIEWSADKLEVSDHGNDKKQYFARIKGDPIAKFPEIRKLFTGIDVDLIQLPELEGEFAIVTGMISENDFEEKAKSIYGLISRIRLGK
ncbi:MAG: homoserine dehydrogenase [Parasporobacterium sp.]|nr:homoserine dehydrogenase [Parasporobacterium sp.]